MAFVAGVSFFGATTVTGVFVAAAAAVFFSVAAGFFSAGFFVVAAVDDFAGADFSLAAAVVAVFFGFDSAFAGALVVGGIDATLSGGVVPSTAGGVFQQAPNFGAHARE